MSKSGLSVEVKGAPELAAKLTAMGVTSLKTALTRLGITLLNKATMVSPVDSGRTRGSLKKGAAGNIWNEGKGRLTIGSNVSHGGVFYPRVLDDGGDKYHYRAGPFAGQSLGGWFTNVAQRSEADIAKALDATKQELLKKWGR
jgi:hypothetical protein